MGRRGGRWLSGGMMVLSTWILAFAGGWADSEWSQFRGPQTTGRSGVAAFPTVWTEKNILWKVEIGGLFSERSGRALLFASLQQRWNKEVCSMPSNQRRRDGLGIQSRFRHTPQAPKE
jgi:hypothetical protein